MLLFSVIALATDAPLLTPEQEATLVDRLERQVITAEALGRAAGLALHLDPRVPCTPEKGLAIVRADLFLRAWKDATDRATATLATLAETEGSPTLAPLRSPARVAAIRAAEQRTKRTTARHRGAASLYARQIAPLAAKCPATLRAAPGWPDPVVHAADDPPRPAAVWVLEPGTVCASGQAMTVQPGPLLVDVDACFTTAASCDCTPVAQLPGAVLAP